jgi:hypothetical protein
MLPTFFLYFGRHALSSLYLTSLTIQHCPPKHCYPRHGVYISTTIMAHRHSLSSNNNSYPFPLHSN